MDEPLDELVVVERAVEAEGEAVGDGGVADVEAGVARAGEDVEAAVAGLGAGNAAVDGLGVDEGDCEAVGGELDGEGDEGVDVALVGVGDHDGVRAPRLIARHCCVRVCVFPGSRRRKMVDFEREGKVRERRLLSHMRWGEECKYKIDM